MFKERLIGKIKNIKDKELLEEIMKLLDLETDEIEYKTTKEQRQAIEEARKQYKINEFLTDKEVDSQIDKWLEK